jgi:hypothetical protein
MMFFDLRAPFSERGSGLKASALAFTLLDIYGNTLRFDSFVYENAADNDWLDCQVTLHVGLRQTIQASFETSDLEYLKRVLCQVLDGDSDGEYEPTEPWVTLKFVKEGTHINILVRFAITLGTGPYIEFLFECREAAVREILSDLAAVLSAFPPRGAKQ